MNTILLLLSVLGVAPIELSVTSLRGEEFSGKLVGLTSQQLVIKTSAGSRTLKSDELLLVKSIEGLPTPQPWTDTIATVVTLVDGSVLHATKYEVTSGRANVALLDGPEVVVPTRAIAHVRLMPLSPATSDQWNELLKSSRESDAVILRKKAGNNEGQEEASAQVALDSADGVLGDVNETNVGFTFDDSPVSLPRRKIQGLVYFHRASSTPRDPICQLTVGSGTRWNVRSLKLNEEEIQGISVAGVRFSVAFAELAKLDYSVGNIDYLSDLSRESVVWKPRITFGTPPSAYAWFSPKFDTGLYGSILMLEDEPYEKGLALHSHSEVTYRLTKRYRRLLAHVGVDDGSRYEADLELKIYADNKVVFSRRITGKDKPFDLDLDMQGIRRLKIVVGYGADDSERGDNLNLCNARLTK